MKLKKKTLKTLSNSILKNVHGGLTTTGVEPPKDPKQEAAPSPKLKSNTVGG